MAFAFPAAVCTIFLIHFGFSESTELKTFPAYFKFGSASSSYQVEGGWNADGKGENVFDFMAHKTPSKIRNNENGDIAADSYHKYKEDVQMLKNASMDFYRFSISWARILPYGDDSVINEPGLQYYDNLINELIANNIQPMVTIYHWDLPQVLQEMGGWVNPEMMLFYERYSDILFERYADRVKHWITFNEPIMFCNKGYGNAIMPPFIYAPGVDNYKCSHHVVLAHAKVYDLYQRKYSKHGGRLGLSLYSLFPIPLDYDNRWDIEVSNRLLQFVIGLYLHPLFTEEGGYPPIMKYIIDTNSKYEGRSKSRLPEFSDEQRQFIKGKADFIGLNYYTSRYVTLVKTVNHARELVFDTEAEASDNSRWVQGKSEWLLSAPEGLRLLLNFLRTEYLDPEIIITENGWSDNGEVEDSGRIEYLRVHLKAVLLAIGDGCNVTAHTTWSIMDNFEWLSGYSEHFGIYQVDFNDAKRTRRPKASVNFLRNIIKTREVPDK